MFENEIILRKYFISAQWGFDILSMPINEMDDYMKSKRAWNQACIDSGIPYTIVSQVSCCSHFE